MDVADSLMPDLMWVLLPVQWSSVALSGGLSDGSMLVQSVKRSFTRDVKSIVVDVVNSLMPDPVWVLLPVPVSWSALSGGLSDGNTLVQSVKRSFIKDVKSVVVSVVDVVTSLMPDLMWVLLPVQWSSVALSGGLSDGSMVVQSVKRSFTRDVKLIVVDDVDSLMPDPNPMWVLLLVSWSALSGGLSDGIKLVQSVKRSFIMDVKSVVSTDEGVVVEPH